MQAGGAMRMRRSLLQRGQEVDGTLGWVSWGLYGGLYVVPLASLAISPEVPPVLATGMYVGALAPGAVFRGQVRRQHDNAGAVVAVLMHVGAMASLTAMSAAARSLSAPCHSMQVKEM